ncbi:MAG: oligosaccharide flippase family protein [Planctomycetes bacterium]|nr:oligosaccharide flippase family protein [Planctomycetota bacterium]
MIGRSLIRATAIQVAGRLGTSAATFLALMITAHALTPARFGVLTFYVLLWAILEVVQDMGSLTAATRRVAHDRRTARMAIRRCIEVRAALLPIVLAIHAGLVIAFREREAPYLFASSLCLVTHLFTARTAWLHGEARFGPLVRARLAGALLTTTTCTILWWNDVAREGPYVLAFAAGIALTALQSSWATRRWIPQEGVSAEGEFDVARAPFLKESFLLGIGALARILYYWMDGMLVRLWCGEEDAGLYNAAYRIFNLSVMVATYAGASALPLLARARARGGRDVRDALHRMLLWFGLAGIPVAAGLYFVAHPLLQALFGAPYEAASAALEGLAFACAAVYVGAIATGALAAYGKAGTLLVISLLALSLNLVLNTLWIPVDGPSGAARATAVTEFAVLLCACLALRRISVEDSP